MSAEFLPLNPALKAPQWNAARPALRTGGTAAAKAPTTPEGARMEKVARQFQALFLMELMKPTTEALAGASLTGEEAGSTNDLYSWFWSEALSGHLSKAWPMPALPGLEPSSKADAKTGPAAPARSPSRRSKVSDSASLAGPLTLRAAAPADASAVAPPAGAVAQTAASTAATAVESLISSAGRLFQLPVNLVRAVVSVESGGRPDAVSSKGAVGLMQLMPGTAREMGARDPKNAWENLYAGAKYLSRQLERFGTVELALAAYNAGPGAVDRHNGIPPFAETRAYVRRVLEAKARLDRIHPQDA